MGTLTLEAHHKVSKFTFQLHTTCLTFCSVSPMSMEYTAAVVEIIMYVLLPNCRNLRPGDGTIMLNKQPKMIITQYQGNAHTVRSYQVNS